MTMRGELSLTSQCTISCKPCTAACSPYRPKAQAQTKSQTLTWSPTMSPYPCSPIQARASTMGEGGEGEACSTHIAPKANGEAQQHPRPALGCKKKSLYVKKKQRGVRLGTYACSRDFLNFTHGRRAVALRRGFRCAKIAWPSAWNRGTEVKKGAGLLIPTETRGAP